MAWILSIQQLPLEEKNYSEQTLQGSKNQFLVNARQDTIKDLKVETHVPMNTDVVFSIIDVSNDQVEGIYPQYWARGNTIRKS
ncbi:hypothetical protein OM428_17735 [Enterococcus gallinarum]|nr:hypothetical protein [Enterococcus gallinarum]